jgi:putative membrane protein
MKRRKPAYLVLMLKGMAMGAADVIPGVSGGTIAFITGIYEELIESVKSVNLKALKLLFTGRFSAFLNSVNGSFLISVLLGIAISIFSLAKGLKFLLDTYPIPVWSFFFGLIIASAIFIAKKIKVWDSKIYIAGAAGIAIAWFITILTPAEANTTWWFIFFSGSVAICAMILPGISGSFILVLLGMYKFIIEAVGDLDVVILLIFISGAAAGIIIFSNVLSWLLKRWHNMTIAVLAGFMVGSLNKVWPWKEVTATFADRHGDVKPLVERNILPCNYEQITGENSLLTIALILAITGFIAIFVIEKLTKDRNEKSNK